MKTDSQTQGRAAAALMNESDKPLSKKDQRRQKAQSVASAGQSGRGSGREKKVQKSKDRRRGRDNDDDMGLPSSRGRENTVEFLSLSEVRSLGVSWGV